MPFSLLDNQVCDNPQSFIFNIPCFFIILRFLQNNLGRFLSLLMCIDDGFYAIFLLNTANGHKGTKGI